MQFGDDERAAAIQIGAVLLFAMLVISMAVYQANVVPNQNKGIEFNHNQEVQGQMQDLRNTVVSVPGGGSGGSVTVDLGTTYPSRTLFVNPGPPSGTLRTVGTNSERVNVSVVNATATGETGDFWNGDARNFTTGALVYEPNYHEYQNPPTTVYEHSLLYNQFRDANLTVSDQTIVNDRQITLVTLDGNLSENGMDSASVTARPISASSNTVAVEADSGPINITVPTRLDNDTWGEALRGQYVSNGGHVAGQYYEDVSGEPYGLLTIELEEGETYDLQMARVGVGSGASEESSDQYITDIEGGGSVQTGSTQEVTVEVRDSYNNPVSGELVNLSVGGDEAGTLDNGTVDQQFVTGVTGSDGQVTVTYNASDSEATDTVTANISETPDSTEEIEYTMDVVSGGGGSNESNFEIVGLDADDPVKQGETLSVDAEITNTGDADDTQVIDLTFGLQGVVDSESVTIPAGETVVVPLSYENTDDKLGDYDVTVDSEDDSRTITVTVEMPPSEPYFDVTIDSTNAPVTEGNTLSADVVVENIGDSSDTQTISMDFGSDTGVDSETVTLNSGESQTITLTHDTVIGDAGDVDVTVDSENTSHTETVTVESANEYFDVFINDTNAPIGAGETLEVDVDLRNRGDQTGEQEIALDFDDDGTTDARKFVELASGEERTVTLTYDIPSDETTGNHDIRVSSENESDAGTVEIESPTDFTIDNVAVSDIVEGETVEVVADISNGGGSGTETVDLSISGLGSDSQDVTLDSGGSTSITLTNDSQDGDAGSYTATVSAENDEVGNDFTIYEDPEYVVTLDSSTVPDHVARNRQFDVTADIENQGEVQGEQDVELRLGSNITGVEGQDYEVIDTEYDVVLDGGNSNTYTFEGTVPSDQPTGEQEVGVVSADDTGIDTTTVTVEPGFSDLNATANPASGNNKVGSVTFDYTIADGVDADRIEYEVIRTSDGSTVGSATDNNPVSDGSVTVDINKVDMTETDLEVHATIVDTGGYSSECVGTIQDESETIRKSDGQFAC